METPTSPSPTHPHAKSPRQPDRLTRILRLVLGIVLGAAAAVAAWFGYAYATSPEPIRFPLKAHYHFRMQIVVDRHLVNFANAKYQTPEKTDVCTAALTKTPVHFHDGLDQFVHIHWDHFTGGLVLKNYGWNLLGGADNRLGYKFVDFPRLEPVTIHGQALPKVPAGNHYYVYTGTASSYQERDWQAFLKQDLRDFFAGKPLAQGPALVPAASAHAGHDHAADATATDTEAKLTKLNDVLGSVVIFSQKDKPTEAQIKGRFNDLIPLPTSSCGG